MVFYQLTALSRTERKKNQCFSLIKSTFNTLSGKLRKFQVILFILRNWAGISFNIAAFREDYR